MGDCLWGNHNINYPTKEHLKADEYTSFSASISTIMTGAGLSFRNIIPQATVDSNIYSSIYNACYLTFGAAGDINDRYTFDVGASSSFGAVQLFNNSGYTGTTNASSLTNRLARTSSVATQTAVEGQLGRPAYQNPTTFPQWSIPQYTAVANSKSLALLGTQFDLSGSTIRNEFYYACQLDLVNTEFNYYSNSEITKSFILSSYVNGGLSYACNARHYIASTAKITLTTGRAAYEILCSDGQTPTSQWLTDLWVYDNNTTLGFPVIGKVPNLYVGQGTYTYFKPVKIQGSVIPTGENRWVLPVGTYAGKTLFMRCYSSTT